MNFLAIEIPFAIWYLIGALLSIGWINKHRTAFKAQYSRFKAWWHTVSMNDKNSLIMSAIGVTVLILWALLEL